MRQNIKKCENMGFFECIDSQQVLFDTKLCKKNEDMPINFQIERAKRL